jgi:hypothetical protein
MAHLCALQALISASIIGRYYMWCMMTNPAPRPKRPVVCRDTLCRRRPR